MGLEAASEALGHGTQARKWQPLEGAACRIPSHI